MPRDAKSENNSFFFENEHLYILLGEGFTLMIFDVEVISLFVL